MKRYVLIGAAIVPAALLSAFLHNLYLRAAFELLFT